MEIELSIHHDGRNWVATDGDISIAAVTLDKLDRMVENELKSRGRLKSGIQTRVRMSFDIYTIPQWIRQYSQHYFNRVVVFEG